MRRRLSELKKSEFAVNTLTVFSGSLISQLIPIVSAPLLSRLYTPMDYGILGIYVSVSSLIGIVATFQYHNAILIPKEDSAAIALLKLSLRNTILTSVLSFILILLVRKEILSLINAQNVNKWILLLPISVFFTGVNASFSAFAVRLKLFKLSSFNRILGSLIALGVSLIGAWLYKDETGLMWGFIISQFVNSIILASKIINTRKLKLVGSYLKQEQKKIAKTYIHFPKYSLATDLLNNFTNQIPVLLLNSFGGQAVTGLFNMCNRLLSLPQVFISNAFGDVFRQRAAHDFNTKGSFSAIFLKTAKSLALLSIIPFIFLLVWAPDLFALVLGENWRAAGVFARILSPLFVLRFINSPLSYSLYLQKKLKFDLLATIYLNVSSISFLLIGLKFYNINTALMLYVLNYSLTYIFMFYKSYTFSKIPNPGYEPI